MGGLVRTALPLKLYVYVVVKSAGFAPGTLPRGEVTVARLPRLS
jgi:hypothetical protein